MAGERNSTIDIEPVQLAVTTEEQYCQFARASKANEFWWYLLGLARYRRFSMPFRDQSGRWWYRIKAGFAWPVDFFTPYDQPPRGVGGRPFLLGWQWPTAPAQGNSRVWMNVIHNLSQYGISTVASNKRRAVRKGLRNLDIERVDAADADLARQACVIWNSHVQRTEWNSTMSEQQFAASWAELADWPGTTVLMAREKEGRRRICAWLIARVIDQTVFIDTIASHTDRLANRPNDTIIFACLVSAARAGVRRGHYSLRSRLESLEKFKQSLGFVGHPFAARLALRWPVRLAMRLFTPRTYRRLLGGPTW